RVLKFTHAFLPRFADRIKRYDGRRPIFDAYHIEPALRQAMSRRVPLKSGGSLVIDQGEALTAIDVNTGSFTNTGSGNLEDTVTANNLEACDEVARQLRLRNIGGIIVVDFVDMDKEGNRRKAWDAFQNALAPARTRQRAASKASSRCGASARAGRSCNCSPSRVRSARAPASSSRSRRWPTRSSARCAAPACSSTTTRSRSKPHRAWPRCCSARS